MTDSGPPALGIGGRVDVGAQFAPADPGSSLDLEGQLGAGLPVPGGDLVDVLGDGADRLGQRDPRVHVGDVLGEVHNPTLALCYLPRNSTLVADSNSSLLDHSGVGTIREVKERRRENLARLLEHFGKAKFAEMTGIAAAQLYQMSSGKGRNARNVSDAHAKVIEEKAGKQPGWLDLPHGETVANLPRPRESEWPFPFPRSEWLALPEDVRKTLITTATNFVAESRKSRKNPKRRSA